MRWFFSWVLFWIGSLFCVVLEIFEHSERWVSFWYPVYSWFMVESVRVQGDGEGPWLCK